MPSFTSVTMIWSPYHTGIPNTGVGNGPDKLRSTGIVSSIEALGIEVHQHTLVPVDDFTGEIGRSFALLRQLSECVREATARSSFPLILAGNCMTSVGVACGLGPQSLSFVVFDAHEDLHTPSTTTSGYFDGMVWPILAGDAFETMAKTIPGFHSIDIGEDFVYCGIRDCSAVERKLVADRRMDVIWGSEVEDVDYAGRLLERVQKLSQPRTLVHLDLDVLDISVGKANSFAAPGGLSEAQLGSCLGLLARSREVVSLTVASLDPDTDEDDVVAKVAIRAIHGFFQSMLANGRLRSL